MTTRVPTRDEVTLIRREFGRWGAFEVVEDAELVMNDDRVAIVSPEAKEVALASGANHAGIDIGEMGRRFRLDLEGAALVAGVSRRNMVTVDDRGEGLALYGRDLFGTSILDVSPDIKANQEVIILNRFGEAIAIGRTRFDIGGLRQDRVTVDIVKDRGGYLRD